MARARDSPAQIQPGFRAQAPQTVLLAEHKAARRELRKPNFMSSFAETLRRRLPGSAGGSSGVWPPHILEVFGIGQIVDSLKL